MADRIRLSLDISQDLYNVLAITSSKACISKSEVLKKAIVLMHVVVEAEEQGKVIGISDSITETIYTQIVGLKL